MSEIATGSIQVAGNAVLDLLVQEAAITGEAADRWGANVQFLSRPVEGVLGGCGAAPAYLLGRLGEQVVLNTNLGEDLWGQVVRRWLERAGIALRGPLFPATAVNLILLTPAGERRSLYFAGDKVDWRCSLEGEAPEWFLAAGYGRVDAGDLSALGEVFERRRQQGTRVIFDPGPWFAGRVDREAMLATWSQVDCLVATEEELAHWLGFGQGEDLASRALALGPEVVVVKRGAAGASFASRQGERGTLPAPQVERRNSVGAGDTFNGRLLFGLRRGEPLAEAVAAAVQLATRVVGEGRGVLGALE